LGEIQKKGRQKLGMLGGKIDRGGHRTADELENETLRRVTFKTD